MWHIILGHALVNYLKKLQKLDDKPKDAKYEETILNCKIYKMIKMEKLLFQNKRKKTERPLQIIHIDMMGPIETIILQSEKI